MALRWLSAAAALAAATPAGAQQITELGIQVTGTLSDPALVAGGVSAAWRPSSRGRVAATLGLGGSEGEMAWRGELLGHFLLAPSRRRGPAVYLGGGLAVVGGPVDRGYLVLAIGIEDRPGGPSGWFAEGGVGGGARLSAGYRWRWFPDWWRLVP
ncbi:MAG TPA: hypothetical protein VG500_01955 [Gemmatimonadales bacterium]|nr:hypothetical protein [Gemmatimonadales bacterium]